MRWREEKGLKWIEFDIFAKLPLVHGVVTRQGGVSAPPFDSLNFSLQVGDCEKAVAQNFARVKQVFFLSQLFFCKQVHGTHLVEASSLAPQETPQADGLIATQPGVAIAALHADCQAAIFYDPTRHVVATVHCGWRGSVQNIYRHTVERLSLTHGCQAKDLLVGISPSLGPQSAQFIHYEKELPSSFWKYQVAPTYFDFWKISQEQLVDCGVLAHHIEIAQIDTFSHPQDFFSHRREKPAGRHITLASLL